MSKRSGVDGGDERWAHFRFSVIGALLAAPPPPGELRTELLRLAAKFWRHPVTGAWVRYGLATLERWYYEAKQSPQDPVGVLARKVREDRGSYPSLSPALRSVLHRQHQQHGSWSYPLHHDNLAVRVEQNKQLGPLPSYESVYRYMKACGLFKRPRRGRGDTAGAQAAAERFERLEVRSYEAEYVNALWHLDFHGGSLNVILPDGAWVVPQLLGILDDYSRLCAHAQWYLHETAENLAHGLRQGFQKRGVCRALMSDNGSAMIAGETTQGLLRLSLVHEKTLPYSPYQNGKQEVFWGQVEGRLLPMLENCKNLTLEQLNEATQAWCELEYNRKVHSELAQTPLQRYVAGKDVGRRCPDDEALRQAFTASGSRTQRRSDGTITLDGVRFEVSSPYRHLPRLTVRYASWDLSQADLADPRSGQIIGRLYPLDKHRNADGRRRTQTPLVNDMGAPVVEAESEDAMAPLWRQLVAEYAVTGLPPASLPKNESRPRQEEAS
jgi:transposase InsO family protein